VLLLKNGLRFSGADDGILETQVGRSELRIAAEDKINDSSFITGYTIYPGYIIVVSRHSLMIETGLNSLGPRYLKTSQYFGGMALDEVNADEVKLGDVKFFDPQREGDAIDLGDCSCEVISTSGHTTGHLSFFLREPGILFLREALRNMTMEREDLVKVECFISFPDVVRSIEKLMTLKPFVKVIAVFYLYFYTDGDVPRLMDMAIRDANAYRSLIESCLNTENGDVEKTAAALSSLP
jgi:hypothetical protein